MVILVEALDKYDFNSFTCDVIWKYGMNHAKRSENELWCNLKDNGKISSHNLVISV